MNKILSILAVVIFAVAVVIALNNRRERIERMTLEREHKALMLENLQKLSALSTKWMIAESAITDMSGTLEVNISKSNLKRDKDPYKDEKLNTRYIQFQITGGNHVKIDILDQEKELLRSFDTPFLFDNSPQSASSKIIYENGQDILDITVDIIYGESEQFWPLETILVNHFQPTRFSGIYSSIALGLMSPEQMGELSFREMDNGDIEIYIQVRENISDMNKLLTYRPDADDRIVGIVSHGNVKSSQWSGELHTFGEVSIFTHYSCKYSYSNSSINIESTLINDE